VLFRSVISGFSFEVSVFERFSVMEGVSKVVEVICAVIRVVEFSSES
jgi:hypothetical protein